MEHDEMITAEDGYTVQQLVAMYNDAVETIWLLQERNAELREESDRYLDEIDELIDKLYS